ncbi:hypothetical protein [Malaciobacter marinus]|jgi:hypothetical protein|uniref:hypothetical protein n=1 Tax=Malaciobacter marinus TaxID=505249 RepID=UPI0009A56E5C|nr:hypothetical protein [Malaciobacter marinus]SKB79845.1 hypothetical protein SAMN06295997_1462 [Malaciobacter marinus]
MNKLTIITFANFRSGGKSSAARLLAERTKSSILNFDTERDAEHYNAVNTINIQKNKTITRNEKELILSDEQTEQTISSKSGFLICDLGGYFDPRVNELESDFYILPSFTDYESIRETLRTAKYILKELPRAKIIFILNFAFLTTSKEREKAAKDFEEQLEINMLDQYKTILMPRSNIFAKLVNDLKKEEDLINENKTLKSSYKGVRAFVDELADTINFKG